VIDALMSVLGAQSRIELVWITMRFVLQWIASEKVRRSVVPTAFWWFSIGGSAILLAYAVHRRDPVFILGQSMGFAIYARNLWFIRQAKTAPPQE
jgi:lipid-A-disaccharide synthase-like uncharacterized protein